MMINRLSPVQFGAVLRQKPANDPNAEEFTAQGDYYAKRCAESYAEALKSSPTLTLERYIEDTFFTNQYDSAAYKEKTKLGLLQVIFNIKKTKPQDVLNAAKTIQAAIQQKGSFAVPSYLSNLGVPLWATGDHAKLLRDAYQASFDASHAGASNSRTTAQEDFVSALKEDPADIIEKYMASKPEAERAKIAAAVEGFATAVEENDRITFPQYLQTLPKGERKNVIAIFEGIEDALLSNVGNTFTEKVGPIPEHDRVVQLKLRLAALAK